MLGWFLGDVDADVKGILVVQRQRGLCAVMCEAKKYVYEHRAREIIEDNQTADWLTDETVAWCPLRIEKRLLKEAVKKRVNTGLSKKMDGIWNRYNLKSTGRIYTFGVLKCSEMFKVLDLP